MPALEAALGPAAADPSARVHVTPLTRDVDEAQRWFEQFEGAGLDGLIAKPRESPTSPTSG